MNQTSKTQGEDSPFYLPDEIKSLVTSDGIGQAEKRKALTAIQARVTFKTRSLELEAAALREALEDLLFVYENADETGYVDGVGFVRGFEQLPEKCRSALATHPGDPKPASRSRDVRDLPDESSDAVTGGGDK